MTPRKTRCRRRAEGRTAEPASRRRRPRRPRPPSRGRAARRIGIAESARRRSRAFFVCVRCSARTSSYRNVIYLFIVSTAPSALSRTGGTVWMELSLDRAPRTTPQQCATASCIYCALVASPAQLYPRHRLARGGSIVAPTRRPCQATPHTVRISSCASNKRISHQACR